MSLESPAAMSENPPAASRAGAGVMEGSNPSGRTDDKLTGFLHHFPGHNQSGAPQGRTIVFVYYSGLSEKSPVTRTWALLIFWDGVGTRMSR